jgi:hypothetical protein
MHNDDEGRGWILLLMILLVAGIAFSPFAYDRFTTSKQWIGEKEVSGLTIEVTRWNQQDPPKGWVSVTDDELVSLIQNLKPDSLARFNTGYSAFYLMEPWGEVKKEDFCRPNDERPRKNDFVIWKRKVELVPDLFTYQ